MDLPDWLRTKLDWTRENIPFGVRSLLGLLLIGGGILGFLPILGFWMIPLGILVIALDIAPLVRIIRNRLAGPEGCAAEEHDAAPERNAKGLPEDTSDPTASGNPDARGRNASGGSS